MKKHLRHEQGYTLIIVLVVLVVFAVVGTTVMTLNLNGATKNAVREDNVQSKDLAVKAQNYLVNKIEYELNEQLQDGMLAEQYQNALENILSKYSCPEEAMTTNADGKRILDMTKVDNLPSYMISNDATGTSYRCVTDWENFNPINAYKKIVTVQSLGDSDKTEDGDHKLIESRHLIGSNLVLDPFYYVISSHKDENGKGGDILLEGGIGIDGNIHVENTLTGTNKPKFKEIEINSTKPNVNNSIVGYTGKSAPSSDFYEPSFSNNVSIPKQELVFDNLLDVNKTIDGFKANLLDHELVPTTLTTVWGPTVDYRTVTGKTNDEYTSTIPYTYIQNKVDDNIEESNSHHYLFNLKSRFKNIYFPRDVAIRYSTGSYDNSLTAGLSVDNAYIGGNFFVGYLDSFDNTFRALLKDKEDTKLDYSKYVLRGVTTRIRLNGNYYVEGNLYITNTILEGNFNIYVKGKTLVYFSSFDNVTGNIFSEDSISMRYISDFANPNEIRYKPSSLGGDESKDTEDTEIEDVQFNNMSVWNGYFYSNNKISFNTPSSYLKIHGGVYAKDIKISSVRGRARKSCVGLLYNQRELQNYDDGTLLGDKACFDKVENQRNTKVEYFKLVPAYGVISGKLLVSKYEMPIHPRLQLVYDPNFISHYLLNKKVYNVDSSTTLSQSVIE